MGSGAFDHSVKHRVMFLKIFQLLFTLLIGLVELLNSRISVAQNSSQTLIQGYLAGPLAKAGLSTVQLILTLKHSILLAYYTVALDVSMLGVLTLAVMLAGQKHASPGLLLA